ncbi:MAG: NfeD family protein [Candidatus Latescibacteria bacterium]|nr:NfeD family protein [Candidatus Latescibacterota bacterium]
MTPWFFAIGLLLIGFMLILIELFLIPGITLAGIGGGLAILGGVVYAYKYLGLTEAAWCLGGSLVLGAVLLRFVIRTGSWRRMVLNTKESGEEGFRSTPSELEALVGKEGVAVTPLHPSGTAIIEGKRINVVTEGGFVERNAKIVVEEVEGNRVVVHPS